MKPEIQQSESYTLAGRGGMGDVIRVAFPLILASSGHAIRLFSDRLMLAWYSQESIAAAMPAGLLCFTFMAFFIGTVGYVNAFVAQYVGAGRPREVGRVVWQGLILAVLGGVVVAGFAPFAKQIFALIGHAPAVQVEEVRYFRILAVMSFPGIALPALNAFWSGRGKTRVVMAIELFCAALNVFLNAALISGRWGFPEWGIVGAGLATSVSSLLGLLLGLGLFLTRRNRIQFDTLPRKLLDTVLLRRLIRFGLPNGLQFGFDLLAFNLFIVFLGTYGMVELEAANIAFGLNAMAFIPIIGLGIAVSVLVGQGVGAQNIDYARRAVRSGLGIALVYNAVVVSLFLFCPEEIIGLFAREGDAAQAEVLVMAQRCLMYVAAYLMLDAVYVVYGHAIRGAGDTHFSLVAGLVVSWGTLALPTWIALRLQASIWTLWLILVVHVGIAATVFLTRYLGGKWQSMKVIDGPSADESKAASAECDLHVTRGI